MKTDKQDDATMHIPMVENESGRLLSYDVKTADRSFTLPKVIQIFIMAFVNIGMAMLGVQVGGRVGRGTARNTVKTDLGVLSKSEHRVKVDGLPESVVNHINIVISIGISTVGMTDGECIHKVEV